MAERIEIWTDVSGILTTDPRICPKAQRIEEISFHEATELACFGAKVLHPATLLPAVEHDIPVAVLNSHKPGEAGTIIRAVRRARSIVLPRHCCQAQHLGVQRARAQPCRFPALSG